MFAAGREAMEQWFAAFPVEHREQLRSDLESSRDRTFRAASWEMVLHAALVVARCSVTLHEDPGTGTTKRPDFFVQPPSGAGAFILEARVTHDRDERVTGWRRELYERVDRVRAQVPVGFHLRTTLRGQPSRQISVGKIERMLQKWLDQWLQDPGTPPFQQVLEKDDGTQMGSLSLRCELHEKPGLGDVEAPGDVDVVRAILRAAKQKSGRYGTPDLPYVIALNVSADMFVCPHEVPEALFGRPKTSDRAPIQERTNGLWSGGKHTRVSGVLVLPGTLPFEVGSPSGALYLNPASQYPAPPILRELSTWSMESEGLVHHPGRSLADFLELPAGWPATSFPKNGHTSVSSEPEDLSRTT
jgi:hypothetical protein